MANWCLAIWSPYTWYVMPISCQHLQREMTYDNPDFSLLFKQFEQRAVLNHMATVGLRCRVAAIFPYCELCHCTCQSRISPQLGCWLLLASCPCSYAWSCETLQLFMVCLSGPFQQVGLQSFREHLACKIKDARIYVRRHQLFPFNPVIFTASLWSNKHHSSPHFRWPKERLRG